MYKILPILLFAYGLAVTTEDIYDNSYALIIGIDKYENVRSLDYAVKDAKDIQNMLIDKFHFQQDNIVLLKNEEATKTSILQEFSNITKKAESNDRVLIFFAGHGETEDLPDGGEMGYLLPVDGNKTDLYISSIKMDEIQTISLRSEAKHILYLIDACYGGIATVGARSLDAESTPNYLNKITQYKSRQIISAGGRGEQVIEKSEWGHSAFTKNLLSGLRDSKADTDSDGIITAQELGTYLKKKVTIDSNNQQTPKTRNLTTDEGEFVFVYDENITAIEDKYSDVTLDSLPSYREELKPLKKNDNPDVQDRRNSLLERWRKRYSKEENREVYTIAYAVLGNDFRLLSLGSSASKNWTFNISKVSANNAFLQRDISSTEGIPLSVIGISFTLNYHYIITDEVWASIGSGILYSDFTWENIDKSTSEKHNIITPVGSCGLGVRPLPSLVPGLSVGLNISTIFYAPHSYNINNDIITINDYAMATSPGIEIGFFIPKLLFWPE